MFNRLFFFSNRRRHTICALVTGVQTCALPILAAAHHRPVGQDRWVSDRLARHSVAEGGHVQALSDGRWVQINELRTSEGGIVGIYTDINEAKAEDARERARELAGANSGLQATPEIGRATWRGREGRNR